MKISVIGTGYVGLVTGACLAQIGHDVVCTDNDASKIDILNAGNLPIYEPGLEKVIDVARKEKRLRFSADPSDAATGGDAIFICVGTPPLPNGDADLSAIDHVARAIATRATSPKLVIEKSTVPARTGEELKRALTVYGRKNNLKFRVASNPEFLRREPRSRISCIPIGSLWERRTRKPPSRCMRFIVPFLNANSPVQCMPRTPVLRGRIRVGSLPASTAPN